jgi:hypothetical protein
MATANETDLDFCRLHTMSAMYISTAGLHALPLCYEFNSVHVNLLISKEDL